jgi:hypothetical protein
MKLKSKLSLALALLAAALLLISCSSSKASFDPSKASTLQQGINAISGSFPVSIAGQSVVVQFAGDEWQATNNGAPTLQGKSIFTETPTGANIEMEQTHVYSNEVNPLTKKPVGWVAASTGAKFNLVYTSDPAGLTVQ